MSVRCFTAVLLEEETRSAIARIIGSLDELFRDLRVRPPRWERNINLHCTLNFFGAVEEDRIAVFLEGARIIHAERFPIRVRVHTIGTFPESGSCGVLWIGLQDDVRESLHQLRGTLKEIAINSGISRMDARPFHPHITIGRWKHPVQFTDEQRSRIAKFRSDAGGITVPSIALMKSVTREEGAEYTQLARIPGVPSSSYIAPSQ